MAMFANGGRKTVAAAGTAEALTSTSTPCSWVLVAAISANTTQVNVGDSAVKATAGATERGLPLAAGESVLLPVNDASKVFVDARTNGEGVTWIYGSGRV